MSCDVHEMAQSLINGNISEVKSDLNKNCSKKQVLEFAETLAFYEGKTVGSAVIRTKNLLE